jgi:hypothetical protein
MPKPAVRCLCVPLPCLHLIMLGYPYCIPKVAASLCFMQLIVCCIVLDPLASCHSLSHYDQQRVQAQAMADFRDALNRIGFLHVGQQAIIGFTRCTNLAMLGLLLEEDIIKMYKAFQTTPADPAPLMLLQEKLLLGLRFWIASHQSFNCLLILMR